MTTIERGTQIGTVDCPGCATPLPVKVNVAGGVYFFCARVLGKNEKTGKAEKCMTRMNFGRTASQKMIAEFLENKKDVTENVQHENRTDEAPGIGHNGGPPLDDAGAVHSPGADGTAPSGIFGALKHFLTE